MPPSKSVLHPPKQSGSAWQFFFTDQLNAAKRAAGDGSKLNVADIAKEAGAAYNDLTPAEKDVYIQRAAEARDVYKKEYDAWLAALDPKEIDTENEFRAAQRKAGKSRKGNLKDPHAPKKPLSAYFLFLKTVRSNRTLTKIVFEDAEATTKQSTLAAVRWREFGAEEKGPFLRQSEKDKAEYDIVRKQYEEDCAARARGEVVPFRPSPKYAEDLASPRLLAAVLPGGPEEDIKAVLADAGTLFKPPSRSKRVGTSTAAAESGEQHGPDANLIAEVDQHLPLEIEHEPAFFDMGDYDGNHFLLGSEGLGLPITSGELGLPIAPEALGLPMPTSIDETNTTKAEPEGNNGEEHNELEFNSVFDPAMPDESGLVFKGENRVEAAPPVVEATSGTGSLTDGTVSFTLEEAPLSTSSVPALLPVYSKKDRKIGPASHTLRHVEESTDESKKGGDDTGITQVPKLDFSYSGSDSDEESSVGSQMHPSI